MADFEIWEHGCDGCTGAMVDFGGSVPPAVAYAANEDYSRLLERPPALATLLLHHDPEVVLTTLYIYQRLFTSAFRPEPSRRVIGGEFVADIIRRGPKQHPDARVRWMGLHVLSACGWISAYDITAALDDRCLAVRNEAMSCLANWRQANTRTFYPPGTEVIERIEADGRTHRSTIRGSTYEICVLDRHYRELIVPALIDRLEDAHPRIRQQAWDQLRPLVSWVELRSGTGTRPADETDERACEIVMPLPHPKGPDWRWLVQDSWQARHVAVGQIRSVWRERSHAILQQTEACRQMVESVSGNSPAVTVSALRPG